MARAPTGAIESLSGKVGDFDEHAGFGEVTADDGRAFWFHCTRIADGSRTIQVGTRVHFAVVPGRIGRWEAADLTPL